MPTTTMMAIMLFAACYACYVRSVLFYAWHLIPALSCVASCCESSLFYTCSSFPQVVSVLIIMIINIVTVILLIVVLIVIITSIVIVTSHGHHRQHVTVILMLISMRINLVIVSQYACQSHRRHVITSVIFAYTPKIANSLSLHHVLITTQRKLCVYN